MHKTAVANRSQQDRESKIKAQYARAQIASWHRYGMTRTKRNIFKGAAILSERELALGSAIQIVKNDSWQATTSQRPQVRDAHDTRRFH
jgi:hypothetical protein